MPRDGDNDEVSRFINYEYKGNSSSVLISDRPRRDEQPAEDEVKSLAGRINFRFGDRYQSRPPPKVMKSSNDQLEKKKTKKRAANVLSSNIYKTIHYEPTQESTSIVYEGLLAFVEPYLSVAADEELLKDAIDDILIILKDDNYTDNQREKEIKSILPTMDTEAFHKILQLGKRITDFNVERVENETTHIESNFAYNYDNDETDIEYNNYVLDESDNEDDDFDNVKNAQVQLEENNKDPNYIRASDISITWLENQIENSVGTLKKNEIANEIIEILESDTSDQFAENELIELLNFENLDLVAKIISNRYKILYSIKLKEAGDDLEKRKSILKEITQIPKLDDFLNELTIDTVEKHLQYEAPEKNLEIRKVIDLSSMQFERGSHFLSNEKVKLPQNAVHKKFKKYEEVNIPAPIPPVLKSGEKKINIKDSPSWVHPAFPGIHSFNRIQSIVYEKALTDASNMLVCAPTGAGKTNIAVLCMLQIIGQHLDRNSLLLKDNDFKIVYIAPMKALVQEVVGNLRERLKAYGIVVNELTGDSSLTQNQIEGTQVIVSTPEKWDIVTRKANDRTFLEQVKLLIIDEIHLLHDERGPVLESIVARSIMQEEILNEHVRIVGISATLPNYIDVATFLRVKEDSLFHFSNSYRPVPLHQTYIGVNEKKALSRLQIMNDLTYEKVIEKVPNKQCIVFVHTRKDTIKTAEAIRDLAMKNETYSKFIDDTSNEILKEASNEAKDPELKQLLKFGFGIHHAGLTKSDRQLVEALMADRHIKVLCSTATLAWGVNLPASLVIIKGTQVYNPEKGDWEELSFLDVMQMMGRAGRPQYDSEGHGIIITTQLELPYYLSLLNEQLPIESQMIRKLPDMLNAEIALGSVQSIDDAISWLGYTYLHIRMIRNPELYHITNREVELDEYLFEKRLDLIHSSSKYLEENGLIQYDKKNRSLQSTEIGRIASHFYITYLSVATYNQQLNPYMNIIDILRIFSMSEEFKYLVVRKNEKVELQKLLNAVPIPIKESVDEPIAKVNALLQAYISRLSLSGFSIAADMIYITQSASRLIRALFEISLTHGWSNLATTLLDLAKMVDNRMWKTQTPLRQFKGIPQNLISSIERTDIPTDKLTTLSIPELGELVNDAKSGTKLKAALMQIPRLDFSAHMQPITRTMMKIDLTITSAFEYNEQIHGPAQRFWIIVDDVNEEHILHYEEFILYKKYAKDEEHYISFTVSLFDPLPPQYFIKIISNQWMGSQTILPLSFRKVILPAKFSPPTDLVSLQPIPIQALQNELMIEYYMREFNLAYFAPIQTQTFNSLYFMDDNCYIASPSGSNSIINAEIAMISQFNKNRNSVVVYIAPTETIALKQFKRWSESFSKLLKLKIVVLNGQLHSDFSKINQGNIIISIPKHWDVFSRQWKSVPAVQNVDLFILDELQFIGTSEGPAIEVIASRMHFISSQNQKKTRIIGLSASLANAQDVGEWLGASIKKQTLFNFAPDSRPLPLNVSIQGFQSYNIQGRMLSMYKSAYSQVRNSHNSNSIVFVSSTKTAFSVAAEFTSSIRGEIDPYVFVHTSKEKLDLYTNQIESKVLKYTLLFGIGIIYEGMPEENFTLIEKLFREGQISVLVCHYNLCWKLDITSNNVIIMGTQFYNPTEHQNVNYPITDIVQMVGIGNSNEGNAKCQILCHAPKKEYYKKFILNAFPVESHLDHFLSDHFNAEIVNGTIQSMQQCVDYLTWTFLYRRIRKNPNYYNLQGVSNTHISEFLSELVETTLNELSEVQFIDTSEEIIKPSNLGQISAFYNIRYTTIDLFFTSLKASSKMHEIISILSSASEFESIPIREGEDIILRRYASHLPLKINNPNFFDPSTKVNILLQCHFSRVKLNTLLEQDKKEILTQSFKLLKAMIDVVSTRAWLSSCLTIVDLSQMIIQAVWDKDSDLLQLPHMNPTLCDKFKQYDVETVFDLIEMDDTLRSKILQFSREQIQQLAASLNRFPNIEVEYQIENDVYVGSNVNLQIQFNVEEDDEAILSTPVFSPLFPETIYDEWWLIICDTKSNSILSIRRFPIQKTVSKTISFPAMKTPGKHNVTLMLMSDSIRGADQEYQVEIEVFSSE